MALAKDSGATGSASYDEWLKKQTSSSKTSTSTNVGTNAVLAGAKLATGSTTSSTPKTTTSTPTSSSTSSKTIVPQTTSTGTPTTSNTATKNTTPTTGIVSNPTTTSNSNSRNIAAEIEAEFQKGNIDWNKLSQLYGEREQKIADNNMTNVESTQALIDRLYDQYYGNTSSKSADFIAGTPNVLVEETVEPDQSAMIARMIQEAAEAQRASRIAALDKAMQNALAALTNQEAGIQPRYYDARNLLAAQSDVNAYNFAQMMAGRGVQGAAAGLPEIYRNAALQGQLGTLERQKQAELDAIARDRAGVQTAYELDKANALADIESSTLQALINQMNADRQYGLQEAQLTGIYGGQPTLAYQQWQADQDYRNRSFEESVRQFDLNYGLDLKRLNLQEVQQQLDEKYRQGQLSLSQRNAALQEAELAFRRKQAEEEAAARAAQQAAQQQQNSNQAYSSYLQQAMNMLQGTYDSNRGSYVGQYSRDQVRSWVLALPLNSQQKANMLNALNL